MKTFRTLVLLLLLAVVGVVAAQWLAQDAARDLGRVFISVGGYDYSATLPHALLALLVAWLALWLLWTLLTLPVRSWSRYRRKQGRARLVEGLAALHAGHWTRAEKLLTLACRDREVDAIAHVAALRAADARGDAAAAQVHLAALAERDPQAHTVAVAERLLDGVPGAAPAAADAGTGTGTAVAAAHPAAAVSQGAPESAATPLPAADRVRAAEALAVLDAPAAQPLPPRGLLLRVRALAALGRAGEAYGLLGSLRQQGALAPVALDALEGGLAAQALREAEDANVLAERWETLPKPLRTTPAVVAAYADRAAALRWDTAAIHSLEHALDAHWDEALAAQYGQLPIGRLDSRRARAQQWLQAHPASPALLLTLGRLARQQGQWLQAQEFLRRALAQGAGAEAWEELGHGFVAAGDEASARLAYANALRADRGEPVHELPGRELRERIYDEAVAEDRDAHGFPHLRG